MSDRDSVRRAWALAVAWAITIFATIPLARSIQGWVGETAGRQAFTAGVLVLGAAGFGRLIVLLRRSHVPRARYVWLVVAGAVFTGYVWSLRDAPEESVHFIEYGVLAALLFSALRHHVRDPTIYLSTIALGAAVGIADEGIQWLVPGRVWDLRDIGFNTLGVTIVVVAIAAGLRPASVERPLTRTGVRWVTTSVAIATTLLGLSLLNTPQRIAWYSARVPGLSFAAASQMAEFGYLHDDPDIGRFRSRFTREALARTDRERATEAAQILDDYYDGARYGDFLAAYPSSKDAFLHEARVHLFRRGHYHRTALKLPVGDPERSSHMGIAFREHQIVSRYFPNTLARSKFMWTDATVAAVKNEADLSQPYESPVSRGLFTAVSDRTIAVVMVLVLLALFGVRRWSAVALTTMLLACATTPSAAPADLTIVFYTDVHTRTEYGTPEALQVAADRINDVDADLVIAGGDVITDGFQSSALDVEARWDAYLAMVKRIDGGVRHVIGNHDLVGADPDDGSAPAADPRAVWRAKVGADRSYGSFDMRGYHFVFLDSIEVGGPLRYRGYVSDEQLAWLERDLAGVKRGTPIVVATHIPLLTSFYQATKSSTAAAPANRVVVNNREVLKRFEGHDLILVLQGHQHASESIVWRGTTFLTGGALSAKWWRGPWHGTEEGFTVIRLIGHRVEWRYVDIEWSERRPSSG